jgi:hypothetical protein
MSNKTECLRCGGGLIKRFDHYECVDCSYTLDDFHFEQKKEIERLREALKEFIEHQEFRKEVQGCHGTFETVYLKALQALKEK